jgi:anaerobic selenocysteine-containing dehydrogenase
MSPMGFLKRNQPEVAEREKADSGFLVHPEVAKQLQIHDGDFVVLSTRYGKIRVRVNLNDDVRKDCLRMTHAGKRRM